MPSVRYASGGYYVLLGADRLQGTKRIGTVAELSLARRVQLAVLAHIRHQYTDYDRLLRSEGWYEARTAVAPVCLKQLLEWRGEGQDEPAELEDIFREIIVIDDDDNVDENDNSSNAGSDDSLSSMEIVTDPAAAHDLDDSDSNDVEWIDVPRADHEPRSVMLLRPPQMQYAQPPAHMRLLSNSGSSRLENAMRTDPGDGYLYSLPTKATVPPAATSRPMQLRSSVRHSRDYAVRR